MTDDLLEDGAVSGYRRPYEEVKELPKGDAPARKFVHRNRKEFPDCYTDLDDES